MRRKRTVDGRGFGHSINAFSSQIAIGTANHSRLGRHEVSDAEIQAMTWAAQDARDAGASSEDALRAARARVGGPGGSGKSLPPGAAQMLGPKSRSREALLADLRKQLGRRGVRGIASVARKFKIADDNGDGVLNAQEFSKCLREWGVQGMSENDVAQVGWSSRASATIACEPV